ncbi:MAG: hypothetical protein K2K37_08660 [Muribaculaceae bacterium]|nr:hypothetical protein [Muribaculaceae bacterium]
MKRNLLILTLLACCIFAQAMSVNDLFKKYRSYPNAQYQELNEKELRAQVDSVNTEEEKEVLRTAKKMQILLTFMEDDALEGMIEDLNSLKGYSMAAAIDKSENMNVNLPGVSLFPNLDPSVTMEVYSKDSSSGEFLSKPLIYVKLMGMTALIYIDGKIKANDAKDFVKASISVDVD